MCFPSGVIMRVSFQITLCLLNFGLFAIFISTTSVTINACPGMFTSSSTTAQPTEVLATYAANQVAATIFFYVLPTLGTQLGINCNPVLRFVMTLLIPKLPNEAETTRMWFSQTIEAKLVSTNALDLTVNMISFKYSDGISTAGNT